MVGTVGTIYEDLGTIYEVLSNYKDQILTFKILDTKF